MLVWCDVETTGLDPSEDLLLEVAFVITDDDLNPMHVMEGIYFPEVDPVVQRMHEKNGLWEQVFLPAVPGDGLQEFEDEFLRKLTELVPDAKKTPLAGSTVSFDREFLKRWMPRAMAALSYRNVDVSSFKEVFRRWIPEVAAARPRPGGNHRALGDCLDSIAELAHYRGAFGRVA